ncbi:MAG: hypothetical protein COA84_13940 [Robiginitomaculum sp.]|nr:MAG: hypothetical protein COA84_13940 [Robiginitomaculum sp.]
MSRDKDKSKSGWIGVDLDGTLAYYDKWRGIEHVGDPIKLMCDRVRGWLTEGKEVKIFTARVTKPKNTIRDGGAQIRAVKAPIEAFCVKEFGVVLEITNVKDFQLIELWDDRAVQVARNTGKKEIWNAWDEGYEKALKDY